MKLPLLRLSIVLQIVFMLVSTNALCSDNITKIKVMKDGLIYADDRPVELEALDILLEQLSNQKGQVWYYRENPGSQPSEQAMAVIDLIIKYRLPIKLSTRPDFSDIHAN